MNRVGFLFDKSSALSPEEQAAWNFLCPLKSVRTERISFQSLDRRSVISRLPHLLWWHFDTSRQLPFVALSPEVVSSVRAFVQKGDSLLLSLLASQYVVDLGVEELKPNVTVKGAWEEAT
jgi:hypothetical protein